MVRTLILILTRAAVCPFDTTSLHWSHTHTHTHTGLLITCWGLIPNMEGLGRVTAALVDKTSAENNLGNYAKRQAGQLTSEAVIRRVHLISGGVSVMS